jgi:hypothetical protein
MSIRHEQIAYIEDQVARSSIANCYLLAGAKTIKDRNPNTIERNLKTLRGLPSV